MNCIGTMAGKKGSGKTTFLRKYVKKCRRLIVVDREGDWELQRGDEVVWGARELLAKVRTLKNPRRRFRLVYREHPARFAAMELAGPGAAFAVGNVTLCIDELAWFANRHRIAPRLEWCLAMGRRHGVNVVGTTREPQEIHDLFFSQSDFIALFHMQPGNGLDRIRKRYGVLVADQLPLLTPRTGQHVMVGESNSLKLLGREGVRT